MIVLKNLAESFITSAIDASATQITIPADHSGKFPNLLEGDNFRCALVNPATEAVEFINVTARANNVLTVSRGEEGTASLAFPVESRIHIRMTAKTWEEMAAECWLRPKDTSGDFVLPQYENADSFSLTGDFTSFFSVNRAVKTYPNKSVGFVESAVFVDGLTTVKVIEMTVPADLTHVEAGLDPDALAKRSLSNEELLGYMTPVPILEMEALEVDCGTLVSGTIKHPEAGKTYPDSTEFHFNLPDEITDFSITGQSFQMRMPVVTELESPKMIGPITCRAAQLSLILSDPSNAVSFAVRYVGVKAGVTLAFADTEAGYPGADVNADGAQLPATTAGLDNPTGKAFVSGIVEYFIFGGLIQLKDGTTDSVLKLAIAVAAGDVIITDQGECVVASVNDESVDSSTTLDIFGDGSCISCYPFNGNAGDLGPYDDYDFDASAGYITGKFGQALASPAVSGVKTCKGTNPIPLGDEYTISVWVPNNPNKTGGLFLLESGTSYDSHIINRNFSVARNGPNEFAYNILGGGTIGYFDDPGGDWIHLLFESCEATGGKLYVNTEAQASIVDHYASPYVYSIDQQPQANCDGWDQLRVFNRVLTAEEKAKLYAENKPGCAATLVDSLPGVPTKAVKKQPVQLKIGAGVTGEYLGPEKSLIWGTGATATDLKFVSDESVKDEIFIAGGAYNTIEIDGMSHIVSAVSESESGGTYITTVTLETPLSQAPIGTEIVKIPNRCITPLSIDTCILSGDALKYTCAKVPFTDPNIKRLSLSFSGDPSLRVKAAKIYTEEGA
ncbi:hypothetical protein [Maridesulfovibrio sp.]|uniref:hypothetical protein n=1 Tax=Maridesulfovibrio sp. TaxID=2795000 RepID=UPI0029CAA671|nr:hypothetical protein [Maridesulfovibrio sp.]